MSISPRKELLNIQKKIYRYNQKVIESSIVVNEPGFSQYEERYRKNVRKYKRISSQNEMINSILKSNVVYIGDYHTCNQSQRSFLRILKSLISKKDKFIIGLELIHEKFQDEIDGYFSNKISEKTFINRIKLKEHWVFDLWENFKPIFDFSKYHKIKIYGIDAADPYSCLLDRDKTTAKVLIEMIKKNPGKRVLVFIGDLHIALSHLPRQVKEIAKKEKIHIKDLVLFENSESIYWQLAEKGSDDKTEVVQLIDGNYCRMHTPPVVCQQSYLNWLEHEEGEIDYDDAKSSFLSFVNRISSFLRIKLGPEQDNVEVFTSGDLSFLKKLRETKLFDKKEIETIKKQILSSESYYIARTKYVYLANLSVNHAAEEASHFIKNLCSGVEKPRDLVDAFYANILHEALGFFGSKIINHKRKCFHEKDFKQLLDYFNKTLVPENRKLEEQTASMVLEFKKYEQKGSPLKYGAVYNQGMDLFLSVTHALGYMLGDRLYYGLMEGIVTKKDIKTMFYDPWSEPGEAYKVYMSLSTKLQSAKIPNRM
ncbi:MAG: hypothetical protein COS89_01465 [Deltaproteobacteria bacterium CG07_land_8_20_14_0_80_38_7]|nr:MAG: hypothetical protein COS89_01465 [Deltaproteobacteria bacterium CG07_land_8_20_14_0_80_38_7]